MAEDIRWHQRLKNLINAFSHLEDAERLSKTKSLSDLEKQGVIQSFEFTHELAWKTIKDFFSYQGNN